MSKILVSASGQMGKRTSGVFASPAASGEQFYSLFGQPAGWGQTLQADATGYTLAEQFRFTSSGKIRGVAFWSPPGAAVVPNQFGIFDTTTTLLVASNITPTWSGLAGSGWITALLAIPFTPIVGRNYFMGVAGGVGADWYSSNTGYFTNGSGPGGSGISSGPIFAPGSADASIVISQNCFNFAGGGGSNVLAYPNTVSSGNPAYGIDILAEVP